MERSGPEGRAGDEKFDSGVCTITRAVFSLVIPIWLRCGVFHNSAQALDIREMSGLPDFRYPIAPQVIRAATKMPLPFPYDNLL